MNPDTWSYLTAKRTQMHLWTRKRRMKFRKRWRRQHHGQKFRWFISEFRYAAWDLALRGEDRTIPVILHVRDSSGVVEAVGNIPC